MKIHACSVAFRHQSISASWLARYGLQNGFDGIEIWAPHARSLLSDWQTLPVGPAVPMLSGYLPVGTPDFDLQEPNALLCLTQEWRARRLRLFAGPAGSAEASPTLRAAVIGDLRRVADLAAGHGLRLAIEIHPQTLADGVAPVQDLLGALDHPAVGLNVDVLHVWEAGCDPLLALKMLQPHLLHVHLKTVTSRTALGVFAPGNVHDPEGHRDGMCPLFEGAIDYRWILPALPAGIDMGLEWFGPYPARTMISDLQQARALTAVLA